MPLATSTATKALSRRPENFRDRARTCRVSPYADQHKRFGPSFLYRYLPFWVATFVERAIIVLVRSP
jgi:hypothetical protein